MVLLHRTNQNRHIVISNGEYNSMEAATPDGLNGRLNGQTSTERVGILLGDIGPLEVRYRVESGEGNTLLVQAWEPADRHKI